MESDIKREFIFSTTITIEFQKNFHDEQEWRYVPNLDILAELDLGSIIANHNLVKLPDFIFRINQELLSKHYQKLWLFLDYDDICYIIVLDIQARVDIYSRNSIF